MLPHAPQAGFAPSPQQMQQMHQAQLRQQVAYMQQAMMAGYPGYPMTPYPGAPAYGGQAYGGQVYGGLPQEGGCYSGYSGYSGYTGKGKGKFGDSKGKGKKGYGKGGKKGDEDKVGDEAGKEDDEGGEVAPRVRPDEPPVVRAQREARERTEAAILKQLQGRWIDAADSAITYVVEGNTCSVTNENAERVFHNRLSMYGVDFCWNARRFWHNLDLKVLESNDRNSDGQPAEVEWNPGKSSPPATQIIWLRDERPAPLPTADAPDDELDSGPPVDASDPTSALSV